MVKYRLHIINSIIILIIGTSLYINTFQNQFIWDDKSLVVNNTYIKNWKYLPKIFSTNIFRGHRGQSNFYRPIQSFTFLIDHSIWGLNPFGYHFTNIVIHILNALLVYFIVILLMSDLKVAMFSALFFLIHPVQTEAVSYISGRGDPLMVFFMLLSFILFIQFVKEPTKKERLKYLGSVLCFILALLSKEASLIFPLLLLLYLVIFHRKDLYKKMLFIVIPFFLIIGIYLWIRAHLIDLKCEPTIIAYVPVVKRLLISLKIFGQYIGLLIFPLNLHMERIVNASHFSFDLATIISLILLIICIILIFNFWKKHKLVSFGLSWFIIGLLPSSNIYPLNAFIAEHWLYLPSIGFFFTISSLIMGVKYKKAMIAISIIILGVLSFLTIRQNEYWHEPISFFKKTLKFQPNDSRLYYSLGIVYRDKQLLDEAKEAFKKALQLDPKYAEVYNDLGNIYLDEGLFDEAISCYKKAITPSLKDFEPYYNLGTAYCKKEDYNNGIINYHKALLIENNIADIHYNLALAYYKTNQTNKAIKELGSVLKLDPKDSQTCELLDELKKLKVGK